MKGKNYIAAILGAVGYTLLFVFAQSMAAAVGLIIHTQAVQQVDIAAFLEQYSTLVMVISYALLMLLLLIVFWVDPRPKAELQRSLATRPGLLAVLLCAAIGLSGNALLSALLELLPISPEVMEAYIESASGLDTTMPLLDMVTVILLAPVIEELVFRGLSFDHLSRAFSPALTILITGVLFGLVHGDLLWSIYAGVLGCVLGYIRHVTGSLRCAIAMHMAFNAWAIPAALFSWPEEQAGLAQVALGAGFIFIISLVLLAKKYKKRRDFDDYFAV